MDLLRDSKKLARVLPHPIKHFLKKLWHKWSQDVKWDKELIASIADYFSIPKKEVKILLKMGDRLNVYLWNSLKSSIKENLFYKITPFYIFELAYWHMTRYQRRYRSKIIKLAKGNVLDFGGGIGDLSLKLAKRGFFVTYADVSGKTFNFANHLFLKNKFPVKVINLSDEKIKDCYDTIICLDVIEHLSNQKETIDFFANHLNLDGILIITNLGFNEMDNEQYLKHPMHIPIKFNAREYLLKLGLSPTKDPCIFTKPKR